MFKKNSSIFFVTFIVSGIATFIATSIYSHILSVDEFGRYSLGLAFFSMVNSLLFQWNKLSLLRFADGTDDRKVLLNTIFIYFVICIILFLCYFISMLFDVGYFYLFVIFYTVAFSLFDLLNANARARQNSTVFFMANLIKSVLSVAISLPFIFGFEANAQILFLILSIVFFIPNFLYYKQILNILVNLKYHFKYSLDFKMIRELSVFGVPLSLSLLCSSSIFSISRIICGYLLTLSDVAIFSAYYTVILQIFLTLSMACNSFGYTQLVRVHKKLDADALNLKFYSNFILMMNFVLPVILFLAFNSSFFFNYYFPHGYSTYPLYDIYLILMTVFLFVLKVYYFEQPYHLTHETNVLFRTSLYSAVLNLIILYPLIEFFGTRGAIISMLISYVFNIFLLCCKKRTIISFFPNAPICKLFSIFVIAAFIIKVFTSYLNLSEFGVICFTVIVCVLTHVYGWFLYFRK